jgi:hypothetical protein
MQGLSPLACACSIPSYCCRIHRHAGCCVQPWACLRSGRRCAYASVRQHRAHSGRGFEEHRRNKTKKHGRRRQKRVHTLPSPSMSKPVTFSSLFRNFFIAIPRASASPRPSRGSPCSPQFSEFDFVWELVRGEDRAPWWASKRGTRSSF